MSTISLPPSTANSDRVLDTFFIGSSDRRGVIDVYSLAIFTAIVWGVTPIIEKRGFVAGVRPLQAAIIVGIVDTTIYWILLLIVTGGSPFISLTREIIVLFVFAGLIGTAISRLALYRGIDAIGPSITNALISSRPLFATIIAVAWLGEGVSLLQWFGIFCIVLGLIVLSTSKGGDTTGWHRSQLIYPLIAALGFAIGNVLRRYGFVNSPITVLEAVTINETAGLVALVIVGLFIGPRRTMEIPRRAVRYFVASGLLAAVAFVSLFAALERGPVSIVDPLSATAPVFTTIFAYFYLRDLERVTRGVIAGVIVIVIGAVLITSV